ncbi:hypothetical protein, partial [Streptomyces smyrnaeus]|uniref:hypothetical protein n=1 Tax=Streptomyces smyrnaeus TaxID=1387713 RepID=UPI003407A6C9
QALSRSLFSHLVPAGKEAEYFDQGKLARRSRGSPCSSTTRCLTAGWPLRPVRRLSLRLNNRLGPGLPCSVRGGPWRPRPPGSHPCPARPAPAGPGGR